MPYQQDEIAETGTDQEDHAFRRPEPEPRPWRRWLYQGRVFPAFWTISSLISMAVNLILIVLLISLGQQLFELKSLVQNQLIGGLYENFQKMDAAHIRTTIPVSTTVPAKFDLPLNTTTTVVLSEDTRINNATIMDLGAGPMYISRANTNIILPAGTSLPIHLSLTVPVDQQIPVDLLVDVNIPLNETELHEPFVGLQEVVKPYYTLLGSVPDSWQAVLCGPQPEEWCREIIP